MSTLEGVSAKPRVRSWDADWNLISDTDVHLGKVWTDDCIAIDSRWQVPAEAYGLTIEYSGERWTGRVEDGVGGRVVRRESEYLSHMLSWANPMLETQS